MPLGSELASGGEGIVYHVATGVSPVGGGGTTGETPVATGFLAKLYHATPDAARVEKLRWMVGEQTPELCRFAAWPTATLHDAPGGLLVGFLMPRFDGFKPIHTLYSPAHRRSSFPQADWSFLVQTAMNCASAFDTIHTRQYVIGDVNQSNLLVSRQALVCLIDCDSFQVQAGSRLLRCEVGVGQYTPSELQGKSFREVVRTPNHDRFGLAVLLFHLLFMGRHPFAGRFFGPGEMPLERAIEEFRFVYSEAGSDSQMGPPPFSLPLRAVSPELGRLFERAFDRGADRPDARPTPAEWHEALRAFQAALRPCSREPGHKVPPHAAECPWCGIIKAGGPNFFLGVGLVGIAFKVERAVLDEIWKRIEGLSARRFALQPPTAPTQTLKPRPPPRSQGLNRYLVPVLNRLGWWGYGLTLLLFLVLHYLGWFGLTGALVWGSLCFFGVLIVAGFGMAAYDLEKKSRQEALKRARAQLAALEREGDQLIARYRTEFTRRKRELGKVRERSESLQTEYEAELPRRDIGYDPAREAQQREQFLRNQFLSDPANKVAGIGPSRVVLLASYGIETAFDITEEALSAVRGIGKKLGENLLQWKENVQAGFRYDPIAVVAGEAPPALVLKYKQLEEGLRGQLQRGIIDLEALTGQTEEQLKSLQERLERASLELSQAVCDWEAMP